MQDFMAADSGKVAVVTGAAQGIGRASALGMTRKGAPVFGIDVAGPASPTLKVRPAGPDDLAEMGALVEAAGGPWASDNLDQCDIAALRRAAGRTVEVFGDVDILFASARIQALKPPLEMEDADWHDRIDVNLTGTANALRAFAPPIVRRGGGRIIVTSSTQGQHGTKFGSASPASKWGIIGLTKSAALEPGARRITVKALVPGLVDTPLTRHGERYAHALQAAGEKPSGNPLRDEEAAAGGPAHRTLLGVPWTDPEDIAPAVVVLASDEAGTVSGTTYAVTGGDSANLST